MQHGVGKCHWAMFPGALNLHPVTVQAHTVPGEL